jgi:hypothetical protein
MNKLNFFMLPFIATVSVFFNSFPTLLVTAGKSGVVRSTTHEKGHPQGSLSYFNIL